MWLSTVMALAAGGALFLMTRRFRRLAGLRPGARRGRPAAGPVAAPRRRAAAVGAPSTALPGGGCAIR